MKLFLIGNTSNHFYKLTLKATESIKTINERKDREKKEKERIIQIEWDRRVKEFLGIAMRLDNQTKCFVFDDEIYISLEKVKELNAEEFKTKIKVLGEKIKFKLRPEKATEVKVKVPIIEKPIEVPKENLEEIEVTFKVTATIPVLKGLKKYIVDNGIKFEDL